MANRWREIPSSKSIVHCISLASSMLENRCECDRKTLGDWTECCRLGNPNVRTLIYMDIQSERHRAGVWFYAPDLRLARLLFYSLLLLIAPAERTLPFHKCLKMLMTKDLGKCTHIIAHSRDKRGFDKFAHGSVALEVIIWDLAYGSFEKLFSSKYWQTTRLHVFPCKKILISIYY